MLFWRKFDNDLYLRKLRNILPQSKVCNVYQAVVESHLRYADVIWGSLLQTKLRTLQRLQNRAKKIIRNARHKDNWSENWMSVENLFRFDRSVMTYKILNKISPESLWDKFDQRSSHSTYATRNCKDLKTKNWAYEKKFPILGCEKLEWYPCWYQRDP